MSNLAGKAYAMNVVTPLSPWHSLVKKGIFVVLRAFPKLLARVQGLNFIHFARWCVIDRKDWPGLTDEERDALSYNYMLFATNFNGTWEQYVDAFSDGIPDLLNLAWYGDYNYPQSIPTTPFQNYIQHNQYDTDYVYNATPGANQRDIKASIRVYSALLELRDLHANADPETFARAYRETLCKLQNCLVSMGYGPAASVASLKAAEDRQAATDEIWKHRAA
ncbi:hypothetical protein R5H30_00790 [Sulfitobacter sp. D35]|uniref:hypothetical protein n=1 Tax=Sulfitobacter sp. D35 TaxID=3083252 RepID=UPI00296E505B|nr:hypothetical protein [Sulfitobacter sp. D35]MDW4496501.1 hypothetical protein [Sulfitobacter sp. D35]